MSRSLTSAMETALADSHLRPAMFVELAFSSGTLYATNLPVTITWNGHDWLGLGNVSAISPVEEGESIQAYGLALTLSGINPALVSIALGEHYQGRTAKVYFALLDEDLAIIADPLLVWRGRMDNMEIEQGETFTIRLACEGRLADFDRPRVRRYNHEDQIAVYPSDRGFEYVPAMVEKTLSWGAPG